MSQNQTQTAAENVRDFAVKRDGPCWLPVCTASDGIERPLWPRFKFWSYKSAMTAASIARQQWNDGLWAAGGHPLQEPDDISEDSPEWQEYLAKRGQQPKGFA